MSLNKAGVPKAKASKGAPAKASRPARAKASKGAPAKASRPARAKASQPARAASKPARASASKPARAASKPARASAPKGSAEAAAPSARRAAATARGGNADVRPRASPKLVIGRRTHPAPGVRRDRVPSAQRVAEMVEEATVDAYGDDEQAMGWHAMISEHLFLPFTTTMLGVEVQIVEIDLTSRNEIVAVCRRGKEKQRVPIVDLPLPEPPPKGFGWIEAYRQWYG